MKAIFSGNNSRQLWKAINAGGLYALGCKCQELESVVCRQQKQISELAKKIKRLEATK